MHYCTTSLQWLTVTSFFTYLFVLKMGCVRNLCRYCQPINLLHFAFALLLVWVMKLVGFCPDHNSTGYTSLLETISVADHHITCAVHAAPVQGHTFTHNLFLCTSAQICVCAPFFRSKKSALMFTAFIITCTHEAQATGLLFNKPLSSALKNRHTHTSFSWAS